MEMEVGKVFVGGISWETTEERLREYFEAFGEVLEAVIMRDRATGRARGFGFVVFADASVAERVVGERHAIDGRTVEAKKAVPRDDHQTPNRSNGSTHGSPGPARTKKIFVGGLPSTTTESDFKGYFGHFGTVTDVVVMYDHNTQRPRGFGFVTYDSEDSVDRVLVRTFHELNGKMVEVKRAVPKELSLSPGPARSPSSIHGYGPNSAGHMTSLNPGGGYVMRMDGRFSPMGRVGYPPPYIHGTHPMGSNFETGWLGSNYVDSGMGYRNEMEYSYFRGNLVKNGSFRTVANRDAWGNVNPSYVTKSGGSNVAAPGGGLVNVRDIWGGSPVSTDVGSMGCLRENQSIFGSTSFFSSTSDSFYSDHAWHSMSREVDGSGPFGYGLGDSRPADVAPNDPIGYNEDCRVTSSNRGIAA